MEIRSVNVLKWNRPTVEIGDVVVWSVRQTTTSTLQAVQWERHYTNRHRLDAASNYLVISDYGLAALRWGTSASSSSSSADLRRFVARLSAAAAAAGCCCCCCWWRWWWWSVVKTCSWPSKSPRVPRQRHSAPPARSTYGQRTGRAAIAASVSWSRARGPTTRQVGHLQRQSLNLVQPRRVIR